MPGSCLEHHIEYGLYTSCNVLLQSQCLSIRQGMEHKCSHCLSKQLVLQLVLTTAKYGHNFSIMRRASRAVTLHACIHSLAIRLTTISYAFKDHFLVLQVYSGVSKHLLYCLLILSDHHCSFTFQIGKSMGFSCMHHTPV